MTLRTVAALFALFLFPAALAQSTEVETQELMIATQAGQRTFQVELADEPEEQRTGLMFRRSMAPEAGMLFDFETPRVVSMWMRNTYLPLDMLFIGADGRVVSIAKRTTPLSERTISSGGSVRYVLEINAGASDALGIRVGDQVRAPAITTD